MPGCDAGGGAQARIDALAPRVPGGGAATLDAVCYKPLGDACATQSILQVLHAAARPCGCPAPAPTVHTAAAAGAPTPPRARGHARDGCGGAGQL